MTRAMLPGERGIRLPTLCLLAGRTLSKKRASCEYSVCAQRGENRTERIAGEDKRLPRRMSRGRGARFFPKTGDYFHSPAGDPCENGPSLHLAGPGFV